MNPFLANNDYVFHYRLHGEKKIRGFQTYAPNIDIAYDFFHQKFGYKLDVLEVEETAIRFRDDDGFTIDY